MSTDVSRRNFIRTAGVATGVAIAAGRAPFSYAQNSKVRVGCIGTGGQGSLHLYDGLYGAKDAVIVAVCDCYGPHQKAGAMLAQLSNGDVEVLPGMALTDAQKAKGKLGFKPNRYYDYKEMLEKEELDAVVIATPLMTHYQIAMDALDAGCHVFCEKTMCHDIECARNVVTKCHDTGKFVQVGHQRRYNPMYNKALMMARGEDILGRVNHIDCQWHRNNDWRRPYNKNHKLNSTEQKYIKDLGKHLNWRLYRDSSGGLMTELATHQLDIASWFLDAVPKRVYGYGGIDYWRDDREVFDNVNLVYEFEVTPESRGYMPIKRRNDYQDATAINSAYTVRVVYSSITANAKKGCSELIQGDKGSFELTEKGSYFFVEPTAEVAWASGSSGSSASENASVITSGGTLKLSNEAQKQGEPITVDNDKSVDQLQFIRFTHDVKTGGMPKANQMVGLNAVIMGISGMLAMREQKEVVIDPAWSKFDFPTPDPGVIS